MKKLTIISLLLFSQIIQADILDLNKLYVGAGFSSNSIDNFEDASGYQLLAGYDLDFKWEQLSTAIELGYMDTGDFDFNWNVPGNPTNISGSIVGASGVWSTAVAKYQINKDFGFLARLGYDFGDDDGAIYGAGIDYKFSPSFDFRGEYVVRNEIDSLQVNLVYYLN